MPFRHAAFLLVTLLPLATMSSPVLAGLFHVNVTVQDAVDNDPGDGECRISSGDFCTLRAAVMEANANPGPDLIILPGNATITLNIAGTGNSAATGDLDITESVTIGTFVVPDDELPVIDASALGNRIFDVRPGTELFALQRVILSGGQATAGAGIYIRDGADEVTLNRVMLRDNAADEYGGGIYNLSARLRIDDSVFNENNAHFGGAALVNDCGIVNIQRSSFWKNEYPGDTFVVSTVLANRRLSLRHDCVTTFTATSITHGDGQALLVQNFTNDDQMKISFQDSTLKNNRWAIELEEADALIMLINNVLASQNPALNCVFDGIASLHPLSKVNLDTGSSCQTVLGTPAWTETDPGLAWTGSDGWHRFYRPQLNEFAVDVDTYCAEVDLIGRNRPIDGDGDGEALCDLGAVEYLNTSIGIFNDGFEAD
ncbi:MAG: hypothetical protein R3F22_08585 [Lysobacteraceae bacterium]